MGIGIVFATAANQRSKMLFQRGWFSTPTDGCYIADTEAVFTGKQGIQGGGVFEHGLLTNWKCKPLFFTIGMKCCTSLINRTKRCWLFMNTRNLMMFTSNQCFFACYKTDSLFEIIRFFIIIRRDGQIILNHFRLANQIHRFFYQSEAEIAAFDFGTFHPIGSLHDFAFFFRRRQKGSNCGNTCIIRQHLF